jgi:hypothetical protein
VPVRVTVDDREIFSAAVPAPNSQTPAAAMAPIAASVIEGPRIGVPLVQLAHARSGDKGNDALIAILARRPEYLPWIAGSLTAQSVAERFSHVLAGEVTRYDVPGVDAFIFQLRDALGGGGLASLRIDPQGKAFGQMLLEATIEVPATWAHDHGLAVAAKGEG